ncbi:MAG TPA: hypothetical protein VGJ84_23430 [Polyangiaceae bacterium]
MKLQVLDARLARHLNLSNDDLPGPKTPNRDADVALGNILAAELHVSVHDRVTIHVQRGAGTTGDAKVRCRVAAVADWGYDYHNRQLAYGDLTHLEDFALRLTGIELFVSPPAARRRVADDLQAKLGHNFKVFALEELMEAAAR